MFVLFCFNYCSDLIPHYCDKIENFRTKKSPGTISKTIELSPFDHGLSFLNLGASIQQGIEIFPNYTCTLTFKSPPGTGLILTFRKDALNDNDLIQFRTQDNPGVYYVDNKLDNYPRQREIYSLLRDDQPSIISMTYRPSVGVSPKNAGFDLAVTLYKG